MIKHYALRLTLWLNGYTPFKFVDFLDHCAKLILLKKVGGGYIFIHRMLLEYFAELTPQSTKGKSAKDAHPYSSSALNLGTRDDAFATFLHRQRGGQTVPMECIGHIARHSAGRPARQDGWIEAKY